MEQLASTLETDRLRIRPYAEGDVGDITRLLVDARTTQHYPRPFNVADAAAWLEKALASHAADGSGFHVIERRDDGRYLGHCGPLWQEVDGRCFLEIGWMVLPDEWGNGYAPEAARRWHEVLPTRFGVDHTASIIGLGNVQSQRVAAKLGLERGAATTFRDTRVELWSRSLDGPDIVVREATPADARGIAFAHVRSWQFAYRGLLPQQLLDNLDVVRRAERRTALLTEYNERLPGARCVVATRGEAVLGFVDCGPVRDGEAPAGTHELYAIYLRPDQLGRGVGARLLAAAADMARGAGATRMTLWALDGNDRAGRAYERAGWRLDGATKTETLGAAVGAPTEVIEVRWALELD